MKQIKERRTLPEEVEDSQEHLEYVYSPLPTNCLIDDDCMSIN